MTIFRRSASKVPAKDDTSSAPGPSTRSSHLDQWRCREPQHFQWCPGVYYTVGVHQGTLISNDTGTVIPWCGVHRFNLYAVPLCTGVTMLHTNGLSRRSCGQCIEKLSEHVLRL